MIFLFARSIVLWSANLVKLQGAGIDIERL